MAVTPHAQAPAPQQPASPPRGASAPPEHAKVAPINNLPNPYETIRNWGTLPDGRKWGSVSAIHVDTDGKHIWAGDRCGANSCVGSTVNPMVRLDPTGKVVASFGAGQILWPHGMDVDRQGNIWVADARSATAQELAKFPEWKDKGHTVMKFSPQGKLLLTIGTGGQAGNPPEKLTEPNDVLVAPDGSIFIAEAHQAQFLDQNPPNGVGRITKWSPDGKLIKTFGAYGYGPSEFRGPHSLAMDSRGRLFVADRGNRRIQIFDQEGKYLDTWYQFSRISGLYIDRNDTLYAIDSESDDNYNPGWRKGLRVGSARTGEVWYFVPEHISKQPTGMGGIGAMGEGVAVDAAGNVYGGEVGPVQGITKFVPRLKR
ncbi:MAG TPA: peptidyl-alpha-hydroxyglycine alpha-amidating lyase family protein [Vicinamibacterales bacterium]|nr:peptidyl-alpha-hydroxyglycine alpha-amidating lyase family protein [Vicinamibacterales bacterium]